MGHRSRAAVAALLVTAAGGSSNAGSAAADFDALRAKAEGFSTDIVHWRRRLHEHAELMYQEHNTSLIIQDVLKSLGIKFTTGWGVNTHPDRIPGTGGTGIVAELGTGRPPIGTVRLIFQPAEEGGAGAKRMREEGVLRDVSRIFGMHLWPSLPSGTIAGRSGLILAGADFFEFRLEGRGGHGAMPHQAVDPIICGVAVVQSLQTLVSRETDPASSAVVSVTKFNSGDAYNVIPGHATIGGTFRAMTVEALDHLRDRIVRVTHAVASAHQCFVTNVTFMPDYFAPTVNSLAHQQPWSKTRQHSKT
ncbi:unnamed protein product [Polarella glacialis]|uniref:Peptidase M20 dimerisation domain-containing protein n=1 Tax=Polarella glacialis TaxID=89957 RepID=A0A813EYV2_POLGL|nr:unnamed protein product [Polarella glacialis]